jgi:hypothetical protein
VLPHRIALLRRAIRVEWINVGSRIAGVGPAEIDAVAVDSLDLKHHQPLARDIFTHESRASLIFIKSRFR